MRDGHDAEPTLTTGFDVEATHVLEPDAERALLREMGECKRRLQEALDRLPRAGLEGIPRGAARYLEATCAGVPPGEGARLGAIVRRYNELRHRLALANVRLVAHVARRFRDRGIAYSDLLQEGFCGLMEAIDRFDVAHGTKLATYATWWIRQSIQQAVASGAYPVRLSPRHLRQLAQNQDELDGAGPVFPDRPGPDPGEMIRRIHTATRPTVSLDAARDRDGHFSLLQTLADQQADQSGATESDEVVGRLLGALRPREQEVLSLRFGLRGQLRHSLSQTGKVLRVSKERVRQIQERAIEKLRAAAGDMGLDTALTLD